MWNSRWPLTRSSVWTTADARQDGGYSELGPFPDLQEQTATRRLINHTHYWTTSIDVMYPDGPPGASALRPQIPSLRRRRGRSSLYLRACLFVAGNLLMLVPTWISFAPSTWRHRLIYRQSLQPIWYDAASSRQTILRTRSLTLDCIRRRNKLLESTYSGDKRLTTTLPWLNAKLQGDHYFIDVL